jgi:hypothetical protein
VLSTKISTAVKASRNEFTEVYALGSIASIREGVWQSQGLFGPIRPQVRSW